MEAFRRARTAIPAVGVGPQFLVTAAAPQVVDGLVAGFADDVPEGDLDGRNGAHVDLRTIGIDVADEALGNRFDLERVHPEDQRREFVDGGFYRTGEIVEGSFANAVEAVIGDDFGEEPVFPGVTGDVGFDCLDAHEPLIVRWDCKPASRFRRRFQPAEAAGRRRVRGG